MFSDNSTWAFKCIYEISNFDIFYWLRTPVRHNDGGAAPNANQIMGAAGILVAVVFVLAPSNIYNPAIVHPHGAAVAESPPCSIRTNSVPQLFYNLIDLYLLATKNKRELMLCNC